MNNYIYKMLLISTIFILFSDLIAELFNGRQGFLVTIIIYSSNFFLYFLGGIICMLWLLYVDFFIYKDKYRIKKILPYVALPAIVIFVTSILSLFTNVLFTIDQNNLYARGDYYLIYIIASYSYLLLSLIHIFIHRKKFQRGDLYPLLSFPILPAIGGTIQAFYYGVLLIWPTTALTLLIIFIFIQSKMINIDALTSLFNKREFNNLVLNLSRKESFKKIVVGYIIDIDDFKKINDTFGHSVGDQALVLFSNILRGSFTVGDFIARIGGDEFAVISQVDSEHEFKQQHSRLIETIDSFNNQNLHGFQFQVSIGASIFDRIHHLNFEHFINFLDQTMYKNKKRA